MRLFYLYICAVEGSNHRAIQGQRIFGVVQTASHAQSHSSLVSQPRNCRDFSAQSRVFVHISPVQLVELGLEGNLEII